MPSVVNTSVYSPNALNQYDSRTVPPVVAVFGSAHPDATVTGNFQPTTRQGALWAAELTVDNSAAPVYTAARVIGVRSNQGPNGEDAVAEETRHTEDAMSNNPGIFDTSFEGWGLGSYPDAKQGNELSAHTAQLGYLNDQLSGGSLSGEARRDVEAFRADVAGQARILSSSEP